MDSRRSRSVSPEFPEVGFYPVIPPPVSSGVCIRQGSFYTGMRFPAATTTLPIYGDFRHPAPVVRHGPYREVRPRQVFSQGSQLYQRDVERRARISDNTDRISEMAASLARNLRIRAAYLVSTAIVVLFSRSFDPLSLLFFVFCPGSRC